MGKAEGRGWWEEAWCSGLSCVQVGQEGLRYGWMSLSVKEQLLLFSVPSLCRRGGS